MKKKISIGKIAVSAELAEYRVQCASSRCCKLKVGTKYITVA